MHECKECIHQKVCSVLIGVDLMTAVDCEYFTDKSKLTEVKQGKWIYDNSYTGKHREIYICSECKHWQFKKKNKMDENKIMYMNYCPYCGAKMIGQAVKGEEEHETD